MVFEPAENEPAEYDPEEDLRDPAADGPTIPSIDPPEEYDPEADFADPTTDSITIPSVDVDPEDVPRELRRHFWGTVLVLNAAILMGSVGLMIAYFWRDFERAGVLVGGCVLLLALTYRRHKRFDFEAVFDDDGETTDGTDGETSDGTDADTGDVTDADSTDGTDDVDTTGWTDGEDDT